MTLLVATTNAGKLREIAGILEGIPFDLVTLREYPHIAHPEETGQTFGENARLKALYYAHHTGLPTVADDSGLEIAALDGAPGVHSARWHGSDYAHKFRMIHELLTSRGVTGSSARFVCHVALAYEGRIEYETEQEVGGEIAPAPRGTHGFGYDPIFYYPPLGRTLAEIERHEKATISHRGKAFGALRAHLNAHPLWLRSS